MVQNKQLNITPEELGKIILEKPKFVKSLDLDFTSLCLFIKDICRPPNLTKEKKNKSMISQRNYV